MKTLPLFRVTTKQYKEFFILAETYDEAVRICKEEIFHQREHQSLFDEDGSLKKNFESVFEIEILKVELLTDRLLQ